jgi:hypothetical protein
MEAAGFSETVVPIRLHIRQRVAMLLCLRTCRTFHHDLYEAGAFCEAWPVSAMCEQLPWIVIALVAVYLPPNVSGSSVSCSASEQWRCLNSGRGL